jgi:hypothetical protein
MTKKKIINPTFYYNDEKQPILVRLSIKDFDRFYAKLKKLSLAAKKKASGKKVLK